jgi:hypothetical protein
MISTVLSLLVNSYTINLLNFDMFQAEEELCESSSDENDDRDGEGGDVIDVEDLGTMVGKMDQAKNNKINQEPKEMVTPLLRKALTKQGRKIIF